MPTLKEIAYRLLVLTGLTWLATWLNRRKILVLMYHDVDDHARDPVQNFDGLHVQAERFEWQMRYLASRYHVIPLEQILASSAGRRQSKPLAAITFDDGYQATYRNAFPVLQRLGLPATVFVIADFSLYGRAPWWDRLRAMVSATRRQAIIVPIQGNEQSLRLITAQNKQAALRRLSPELHGLPPERREVLLGRLAADLEMDERALTTPEPLSVRELREMAEGGISVGSHGRSHDSFLHLSREDLLAELNESKRVLESVTGRPVTWLSYPYGEFSDEAMDVVIRAGFGGAVTTIEGLNDGKQDPYAVRRIGVNDNMSFAQFIVAISGLRDHLKGFLRLGDAERANARPVPSGLP